MHLGIKWWFWKKFSRSFSGSLRTSWSSVVSSFLPLPLPSSLFPSPFLFFSSFCDPERKLSAHKAFCPHLLSFLQLFWMRYFISSAIFLFYSPFIFFFFLELDSQKKKKKCSPFVLFKGTSSQTFCGSEGWEDKITFLFWSCLVSQV